MCQDKNDGFIFPYGIKLEDNGLIQSFPAMEIFLPYKDGGLLSFIFLIDSGASISALPKSDAPALGIDYKKGGKIFVSGINGEPITAFRHKINAVFKNETVKLPLLFMSNDNAPRVLGREGIFNKFTIVFEEENQRSGFIKKTAKHAGEIKKILDLFV